MQKKIISSLVGNKIYSNFRANNLLKVIQAKYPTVVGLLSSYLHIFESKVTLNSIELNNGPKLHTISLSFNQKLKDDGVIEIINNIPQDTSVIAFVECGITDLAGQKIIDWAYKNDHLIAVYLEGNNFTDTMYSKFEKLKSEKPNLTILSKWANEGFEKMVKETYK